MGESKSAALPLGYAPIPVFAGCRPRPPDHNAQREAPQPLSAELTNTTDRQKTQTRRRAQSAALFIRIPARKKPVNGTGNQAGKEENQGKPQFAKL
jgi:hypothetical protein